MAAALGGRTGRAAACGSLRALYLSSNQIGDDGASALAAALGGGACCSLRVLFLDGNQIGESGASALAAALGGGACGSLHGDAGPSRL